MKNCIIATGVLLLLSGCFFGGGTLNVPFGQIDPYDADEPYALYLPAGVLDDMEALILSAGTFWEDWWGLRGIFDPQHLDTTDEALPPVLQSQGFSRVLPTAEITSLDNVRVLLSAYYTQSWLDNFLESGAVFTEYNGELFVQTARYGAVRPNWETATHTLVHECHHTIIETTVTAYDHRGSGEEMPSATLTITIVDGRINSGLDHWITNWVWDESATPAEAPVWEPFIAAAGETLVVIDLADRVLLESFDALHATDHSIFWSNETGDNIIVYVTQPIFDVQLIKFSEDWDDDNETFAFTLTETHAIADTVQPGEGILIENYISIGTLPVTGIAFYDAAQERHVFAIHHDNSDSPHWFLMWDITAQLQ